MAVLVGCIFLFFLLAPYLPLGRPTTLWQAAGILLLYCLYLGVASAVFGLLRVPLMQRLFERPLGQPLRYRSRLLPGTALLFMLPIAPVYLLLLSLNNDPGDKSASYILLGLLAPSLPWLASWGPLGSCGGWTQPVAQRRIENVAGCPGKVTAAQSSAGPGVQAAFVGQQALLGWPQ